MGNLWYAGVGSNGVGHEGRRKEERKKVKGTGRTYSVEKFFTDTQEERATGA